MVEGVDEWQRRGTIERPAVVKGRGDAHGRLIDVRDAKVDRPHGGEGLPKLIQRQQFNKF